MSHRYGRHGFDAWSRQRKRRINRFTRSLVSQSRIAVVHLHVNFANRERIFIVTLDENGTQIGPARQMDVVDEFPPTKSPHAQASAPLEQLKYHARLDAAARVETDIAAGDPSLEEELRMYARAQGLAYARDHITVEMAGGRTAAQLRDIYVDAFLEEYRAYYQQETQNGNLPDENTRRMKKRAREDRAQNAALHKSLSPRQLDYQAAIRALEVLRLDTRNDTDYLTHIEKFAEIYLREYTNEREVEKERFDRSDRFPESPRV